MKIPPNKKAQRNQEIIWRIIRGESQSELAREYNVKRQCINQIYHNKKNWEGIK